MKYIFASVLALSAVAYAHQPKNIARHNRPSITTGTAVGGAEDLPKHRPTIPAGPKDDVGPYAIISVINMQTVAVTTAHVDGADSPTLSGGDPAPGTIGPSETVSFAMPTGYSGNVAVASFTDPSGLNTSCDTLIEFSNIVPPAGGDAVADIDISMVNGYSAPITCSCNDVVVTGCNIDLLAGTTPCDDPNGELYGGCCANPLRADGTATAPTEFFSPCVAQAYTYPTDNAANSYGQCQGVDITCCIGTDCPAHPAPSR